MKKIKFYLKYRKKTYLLITALLIAGFIVVIFIFGTPKHYVIPILSIITTYGFLEFVEYKRWKKENY